MTNDTFVSVEDGDEEIDVTGALIAIGGPAQPDRLRLHGELGVRALLIRLRQIAADKERNDRLAEAVLSPYKLRSATLMAEERRIRESVEAFLKLTGDKVSFADAGTAYLSSRGPKVNVTDKDALLAWWRDDAGREVPMTEPQPDLAKIKLLIMDELKDTGEVPPAGAGVEVEGPSKGLVVRG